MINPDNWKITLPLFPPEAVMDNSMIEAYMNCGRYGLYRYGLHRGLAGKSWPIQYGNAYHKYREVIEKLMEESGIEGPEALTDKIHVAAMLTAMKDWEDPPIDHKFNYLTFKRATEAMNQARVRVTEERRSKRIIITRSEDSFDLEYNFWLCITCGETGIGEHPPTCKLNHPSIITPRHGGRVDQFTIFASLNDAHMIRDFKTTGRKGPTYEDKFDPNAQLQGYVWAGSKLSGRQFDGALIETVYNTTKEGPLISQHYVSFSEGQLESWEASMMMFRGFITQMWSKVDELGYLAFPQRTQHCTAYGGCPFREPCKGASAYEIENWLDNYTIDSVWDFLSPIDEEAEV